ncbi:MAG TPA: hypothetical protein VJS39_12440 [Gemmatimonadaceae bacterium]|nr:hypothetical protein [Gemmatimonadaceae bacterium]
MKSLDPELAVLSNELQRLDYTVVNHGDFVCVRLPLISSVRIHHGPDGHFRFVPQVGPFNRSTGLFVTSGISVGAVGAAALMVGLAPLTFVLGFLGIVALAHDACRFAVTEGCLTRLQQLISARSVRAPLTSSQRPLLGESAQYTFLDQRAADTTVVNR